MTILEAMGYVNDNAFRLLILPVIRQVAREVDEELGRESILPWVGSKIPEGLDTKVVTRDLGRQNTRLSD